MFLSLPLASALLFDDTKSLTGPKLKGDSARRFATDFHEINCIWKLMKRIFLCRMPPFKQMTRSLVFFHSNFFPDPHSTSSRNNQKAAYGTGKRGLSAIPIVCLFSGIAPHGVRNRRARRATFLKILENRCQKRRHWNRAFLSAYSQLQPGITPVILIARNATNDPNKEQVISFLLI